MRLYGVFLVLDLMLIVIVIVSVLGIFKTELGILEPELAMIIITAAFGIGGWLFTAHQSQIQRQKQNALDVLL